MQKNFFYKMVVNKTITTQKHTEEGFHYLVTCIAQRYFSSSKVKSGSTSSLLTHAKMRCML